jgi:hypothetical protein
MRALVQLSLRYRPDRIILGEDRSGDAAIELIHAMNTGHSGSFCTVHANSAHVPHRGPVHRGLPGATLPLDRHRDRLHRISAADPCRARDQRTEPSPIPSAEVSTPLCSRAPTWPAISPRLAFSANEKNA